MPTLGNNANLKLIIYDSLIGGKKAKIKLKISKRKIIIMVKIGKMENKQ